MVGFAHTHPLLLSSHLDVVYHVHNNITDWRDSLPQYADNPEVTVGGHAPLKAETSRPSSTSPFPEVQKRDSIVVPLLEPAERPVQGAEFTGKIRYITVCV